jgi:hypothetical protein
MTKRTVMILGLGRDGPGPGGFHPQAATGICRRVWWAPGRAALAIVRLRAPIGKSPT